MWTRVFLLLLILLPPACIPQTLFEFLYEESNRVFTNSPIRDCQHIHPEYDFIIIGSGSSGSVVANRLSEVPEWKILLIEAGKEESIMTDIPLSSALGQITSYNWGYKSEPTPNACRQLENGVCNWPKGRAIGGSSVLNFLIYTRGGKKDFDEWVMAGNRGWSYEEILPFFKKMENVRPPSLRNPRYRGLRGNVDIEYGKYETPLMEAFFNTGRMMGYKVNDPNAEELMGFSKAQATMRNGRRCSAGKAYVRPAATRPNLDISMRTWATRIVIDPMTKTAIGVEFLKNRQKHFVRARREVILSAGAIASPQLLMLSGIGPADHLAEIGIPVYQNSMVGYNLMDHNSLSSLTFLIDAPIGLTDQKAAQPLPVIQYFLGNTGPLTMPGGAEGVAFVKTNFTTNPPDVPDVEIVIGIGSFNGDTYGSLRKLIGFTDQFYYKIFSDLADHPAFSLVPVLMKPRSRGRIKLRSRNPFHWPSMQPNYFGHKEDLRTMVEGVKMTVQLGESPYFRQFGARFLNRPYPGCLHVPFRSDEYWECIIVNYSSSLQHQSGTCKMGPSSDPGAVVDPELRVYGINNLRVVDASIIPIIPASHTNSIAMLIGEKASDMIKKTWMLNSTRSSRSRVFF